jgi:uroporphyrinogen decarboxylase
MTPIPPMTSMQRVVTTLSHREPDRVPLFLLLTMHGAKELGLGIREYFSTARNVVEGQLRLREKFNHDCLYTFFYASIEVEAWGGEVIYRDDGPPNSGQPLIGSPESIRHFSAPDVRNTPCLRKVLDAIAGLKAQVGDTVPIIGVVMSPFSLPVMQMGFAPYLDLLHERPVEFEQLLLLNEAFCAEWANAQLDAGATAICYFDPMSSPTMIPRAKYLETGFPCAKRMLAAIKGPVAIHFASGRCLPIADLVPQTGAAVVGVSDEEDLAATKAAFAGKASILGNLNGLAMRGWDPAEAGRNVRRAIAKAASGGGFLLAENHGEIPLQVPDDVLHAIGEATRKWGQYPIRLEIHD